MSPLTAPSESFMPTTSGIAAISQQRCHVQGLPGPVRHVVDHDRHRRRRRDGPQVRQDPRRARARVGRHDHHRRVAVHLPHLLHRRRGRAAARADQQRHPYPADISRHVATTAARSAPLSVAGSPVVPSATSPAAPSSRTRRASADSASSATDPSTSNGVTSGTKIPESSMPSRVTPAERKVQFTLVPPSIS